jgi:hypothetical protein
MVRVRLLVGGSAKNSLSVVNIIVKRLLEGIEAENFLDKFSQALYIT